ncbi:hypothetical protein B0H66DRAFT_568634 [Apodospora peruviana]|uniref:Uncharacterized protein n=1 Tax=Apodospora peruviana TaxID=516989 RepID=A0AAE0HU79_9PEZI|nr:hypothetical protein B0H66DRAFT_568634 [Apodospora peruviana]
MKMDFIMQTFNLGKRRRAAERDDEEQAPVAKKARQFDDAFATARDTAPSPSPSPSALSTPVSLLEDRDPFQQHHHTQPLPPKRCTIISGLNQARRNEELRRYPGLHY